MISEQYPTNKKTIWINMENHQIAVQLSTPPTISFPKFPQPPRLETSPLGSNLKKTQRGSYLPCRDSRHLRKSDLSQKTRGWKPKIYGFVVCRCISSHNGTCSGSMFSVSAYSYDTYYISPNSRRLWESMTIHKKWLHHVRSVIWPPWLDLHWNHDHLNTLW